MESMTTTADTAERVVYSAEAGVARITFNRPEARNAMSFEMYDQLEQLIKRVNADNSIRVLVLTGAGGKAFASGTDIAQFKTITTKKDVLTYEERIDRVLDAVESCRVPTIAAISGACTGGGGSIAMCCDLRIAARHSTFGYPVARTVGNCMSLTNYARLVALIGAAKTKELVFCAKLVDAAAAKEIGFVSEVVEDAEQLEARVGELTTLVASLAPLTLEATKEAVRRVQYRPAKGEGLDLMLRCYLSDDFKEGVDAFLNKRKPQWRGH
jgi:enoyl-CoA hydratase